MATIAQWIQDYNQVEKDFIVLGDVNIQNEVYSHLPPEFRQSEANKLTFETKLTKPKVSNAGEKFFT